MGVRYRRNMCECLGGRPGPWGGMPRMLCAPAGDLARGGLIVESESFAGRERGCDKSEKTQCYGVVWARPHSLRSGAELKNARHDAPRTEAWIAPRTLGRYRTPLASPRPRLPTGSEPPRGRAAGPEPPDRPPRLPASSGTYQRSAPRIRHAHRLAHAYPGTLHPCLGTFQPDPKSIATEGRPPWRALDAPWRS